MITSESSDAQAIGNLTYQSALDIARNTEGALDLRAKKYLDRAVTEIWMKMESSRNQYIFSPAEFAVFNHFIQDYKDHADAERAIDRYWLVVRMDHGRKSQSTGQETY